RVGLRLGIGVDGHGAGHATEPGSARSTPDFTALDERSRRSGCLTSLSLRGLWIVDVLEAVGRGAVALKLGVDPGHGRPLAIRSLLPVAESGQRFDRRLVPLEIEPTDERLDGVIGGKDLCTDGRSPYAVSR